MLNIGSAAPDFELPDTEGRTVGLRALRQRGPVLLAFFKVSCPTCQYTVPFLERLRESNVAAISQDDRGATEHFRARYGITVQTLLDPALQGYPVSNAYHVSSVPTLYLVETDGVISMAGSGFSRADLEKLGEYFQTPVFRAGEQTPAFKPG